MQQPVMSVPLGKHWGDRVAALRADLGLSQQQLADICGITQQTVSKIETGRTIPHDKMKLLIAQRTGQRVGVLFAWPEQNLSAA